MIGLELCSGSAEAKLSDWFRRGKKPEGAETNKVVVVQETPAPVPAGIRFRHAYDTLLRADQARDNDAFKNAIALYGQAAAEYERLTKTYADWQPGVVRFRIAYCQNQIEGLKDRVPKRTSKQPAPPRRSLTRLPVDARSEEEDPVKTGALTGLAAMKEEAKRLMKDGEAELALEKLMAAIKEDPDDRDVRLLVGVAQCQIGRFEDAVHLVAQLIEEDSDDAIARTTLGSAYFGLGRFAEAREQWEWALKLNPDLSEVHYNLAHVMLALDPPDRVSARLHYGKALSLGGTPDKTLARLLAE